MGAVIGALYFLPKNLEINTNLDLKISGYYGENALSNCKIGYQNILLDFSTTEKSKTFPVESNITALLAVFTNITVGYTAYHPTIAISNIDNADKTFTVTYSAEAEFTISVSCLLFGA